MEAAGEMKEEQIRYSGGKKRSRREEVMEKMVQREKEIGDSEGGEGTSCRGGRQTGSSREGRW